MVSLPQMLVEYLHLSLQILKNEVKRNKNSAFFWRGCLVSTHLTHQLVPAVQVGGSENVVSLQRLQQKVVPDAGDAVRGVRGLRRAGGPEVGAEALVRLGGPQASQFLEVVGFVSRSPIA